MQWLQSPFPWSRAIAVAFAIGACVVGCSSDGDASRQLNDSSAPRSTATTGSTSTTVATTITTSATSTTTTQEPRLPEVHVAPDGEDVAGNGAFIQPVRSIQFAVETAAPGDTIFLAAGTYGPAVIEARTNLTLIAADGAVIEGTSIDSGAGLVIKDSSDIAISGAEVTASLWGIQVVRSTRVSLVDLHIHHVGQEAISVASNSQGVLIERSTISHTGQRPGEVDGIPFSTFGEGIYVGSAGRTEDGLPDATTDVTIRNNEIFATSGEAVDVKSPASNVSILGNRIHDLQVATGGAIVVGFGDEPYDANVDISANLIWNVSSSSQYSDGNGVWLSSSGQVRNNVIWNMSDRGIYLDETLGLNTQPVWVIGNVLLDTGLGAIVFSDELDVEEIELTVDANVVDTADLPPELSPFAAETASQVLNYALTLG